MDPGESTRFDAAATFFVNNTTFIPKTGGIVQSAQQTGAGNWFLTLTQSLPLGEYICGAFPFVSTFDFVVRIQEGDATHKAVIATVGGVAADINMCAWFARAFS